MDKAQKQLIDTYFRKRNIAVGEHPGYFYKLYELKNEFVLNNNLIDFDKANKIVRNMENHTISYMLENHPEYLDYFDFDLSKLSPTDILLLTMKQSQLENHPKLKPYLNKK